MKIINLLCIVILCCSTFVGFSEILFYIEKNGDVIQKLHKVGINADKKSICIL